MSTKELAIKLRKNGKSYNEINRELGVPKSTLSCWLKNIEVEQKYLDVLLKRSRQAGREALIKRNKQQTVEAEKRAEAEMKRAKGDIKKLDLEKLKLIGAALYMGEGGKTRKRVDFTNSNPETIKIIMKFFRNVCKVENNKFSVQLSIHDIRKTEEIRNYWSNLTGIPISQFIKVNTALSKYSKKRRKNMLQYGTIQIRITDVKLFHTIIGWTQGIVQQINNVPG